MATFVLDIAREGVVAAVFVHGVAIIDIRRDLCYVIVLILSLLKGGLCRVIPVPGGVSGGLYELGYGIISAPTYHGSLTDQFRKMAAITSKVTSVTTALPSLKKRPATAGNSAKPRGKDCQGDSSGVATRSLRAGTRGKKRSSVEERRERRASETVSDKMELRRCAWDGSK